MDERPPHLSGGHFSFLECAIIGTGEGLETFLQTFY